MSDEELGTEDLSETAPVEEPAEVVSEEDAPAEAPVDEVPPAPMVPPVLDPPTALPPRNQTGLFVAIGAVVVVVILALVFWQPLFGGLKIGSSGGTTATTSESKDKIGAALGFIQAILDGDTLAIKPYLTDDAQAAGTDAQWKAMAAGDATGNVKFSAPAWSGDTTAVVTYTAPGATAGAETTGTLTFSIDAKNPLLVTMQADAAGTTDSIAILLQGPGPKWRILSLTSGTSTQTYDAAFIKSIVPTDTAQ